MLIVVTDITRMRGVHCCVAGIGVNTGRRIRPVLSDGEQLTRDLLTPTGPFGLGAVVDLGKVQNVGIAPSVEDREFDLKAAKPARTLSADDYWQRLSEGSQARLRDIFGEPLELPRGRNAAVPEAAGIASLGLFRPAEPPRLEMPWERPTLHLSDGDLDVSAPVTDLRFYGDGDQPLRDVVEAVAERIDSHVDCVLSVGLARAHQAKGDTKRRHWFQVNGIHLADDPLWGVTAG